MIKALVSDGRWVGETKDYSFSWLNQDFEDLVEEKALTEEGAFAGLGSTPKKDSYKDIIEQGAFARTIDHLIKSGRKLPVLWQHYWDAPIGSIRGEDLKELKKGLRVKGNLLLSIQQAREARDLAIAGILGGMSIGFTIPKGGAKWDEALGGRRITEVRLWEISFVTFPANAGARFSDVKGDVQDDKLLSEYQRLRALVEERGLAVDPVADHSMQAIANDVRVDPGVSDSMRKILADMEQLTKRG